METTSPIRIGNLPVGLVCASTGELAFIRLTDFPPIHDLRLGEDGPTAFFDKAGFSIGDVNYDYGVLIAYKTIPDMLYWLQKQELESPF